MRPLLNFSRQETAAVCQQQQLSVWEDSTNQDMHFRRNRVRLELLPYLREHFNPQVERALSQMAEIAAEETAYLETQASAIYAQCILEPRLEQSLKSSPNGCEMVWIIQRAPLRQAPLALQRRVVKKMLQKALQQGADKRNMQPPNFFQVEKLIALLSAPNGSQSDPYPGGWIAQVKGDAIALIHKPK